MVRRVRISGVVGHVVHELSGRRQSGSLPEHVRYRRAPETHRRFQYQLQRPKVGFRQAPEESQNRGFRHEGRTTGE